MAKANVTYPRFSEAQIFLPPSPAAPSTVTTDMRSVPSYVDAETARFMLQRARVLDASGGELPEGQYNRRPTSPALIKRYANDMIDGKWVLTHQDIAITQTGEILDGQHRLLAVLLAYELNPHQKPIPLRISYNVNPDTFAVVDTGKSRNSSDVLAIQGVDRVHAGKVGHAAKLLYCYFATRGNRVLNAGEAAIPEIPNKWARLTIPNERVIEVVEAHPRLLDEVEHTSSVSNISKLSPGALVAARYLIGRACPAAEVIHDWFEVLRTGQGHPYLNHPAFTLRDWSLRLREGNNKVSRKAQRVAMGPLHMRLTLAMWNHSIEGNSISQPAYKVDGLAPNVLPGIPVGFSVPLKPVAA